MANWTELGGDNLAPGPDGHIRHPDDKDLVWWESKSGLRFWIRQSRWEKHFMLDGLTAEGRTIGFGRVTEQESVLIKKRNPSWKWKRTPIEYVGWDADTGPWEVPDAAEVA